MKAISRKIIEEIMANKEIRNRKNWKAKKWNINEMK